MTSPTYKSPLPINLAQSPNRRLSFERYMDNSDIHDAINMLAEMALEGRKIVRDASDLTGDLFSDIEYFIDGQIDMGTTSIVVPAGGLHFAGHNIELSSLFSSANNYTMFITPASSGSGSIFGSNCFISVTGTGSEVFDLIGDTGNELFEWLRVDWIDCTSLGTVKDYAIGGELGNFRRGGTPSLTLDGNWVGYRIVDSAVGDIDNAMTAAIFAAGATLSFSSRFFTDMGVNLGTTAPFADFSPSNFAAPSLLQLVQCIVSRNGVIDAGDTTILPNISASDLECAWHSNQGIDNTFVGGTLEVTSETATTISSSSTFVALAGTFTAIDLQHFDEPSNGQLRHLGHDPREFNLYADLALDSAANKDLVVRVRKYDASAGTTSTIFSQLRVSNNFAGSRDQAFFNFFPDFVLDQNDYVFLEVANNTDTNNITAVLSSSFKIIAR